MLLADTDNESPENIPNLGKEKSSHSKKNTNNLALMASMQQSVQTLADRNPEAASLLYFLSLLPFGVQLSTLQKMWNFKIEKTLAQI